MRCLSAEEVAEQFGTAGFRVSDEHRWYRRALVLDAKLAAKQVRVPAGPPESRRLPLFIVAVNAWLRPSSGRLLWVDHWEDGIYHDPAALLVAARNGIGESRSIDEAPGNYFEPHPYEEQDQSEWSQEQRLEAGLLVGLLSLLIVQESDGWLIADGGGDRFEVWEGNIFFHSADRAKIDEACTLVRDFECGEVQ